MKSKLTHDQFMEQMVELRRAAEILKEKGPILINLGDGSPPIYESYETMTELLNDMESTALVGKLMKDLK